MTSLNGPVNAAAALVTPLREWCQARSGENDRGCTVTVENLATVLNPAEVHWCPHDDCLLSESEFVSPKELAAHTAAAHTPTAAAAAATDASDQADSSQPTNGCGPSSSRECASCAAPEQPGAAALLRCAGCRSVHYCAGSCQQQHWPSHKDACRKARQAAAKSKEKVRLEKQAQETKEILANMTPEERRWSSWCGKNGTGTVVTSDNMHRYAPIETLDDSDDPKPKPKPTPQEAGKDKDKGPVLGPDGHWDLEAMPNGLGAKHDGHTWRQTVDEVEVRVLIPEGVSPSDVTVDFTPETLAVTAADVLLLSGNLRQRAYIGGTCDPRNSSWYIADGQVVVIQLIKWVRQNVGNCSSLASTWWPTLFEELAGEAPLAKFPPKCYYSLAREEGGVTRG